MSNSPAYDFVVVGAGASGCAVAARLSENPQNRVALIEAGGAARNPLLTIPALAPLAGSARRYNWSFATEPVPALGDRRLVWLQGKVLGGSSSINGMVYSRGHPREYDLWRQMGCDGWGSDDVLPVFRRLEGMRNGDGWHGTDGPLKLDRAATRLPLAEAFLAAAAETGFPVFGNLHHDIVDGFGYYDINVAGGRRIGAATAYLDPRRRNLAVLTRARARRIIIEHGRAAGVEIHHRGVLTTVRAAREVIVCGGAVKSPHLLLLSGIGPPDQLREFDIPVVAEAPGIGRNLQNHPCYRPRYACAQPVTGYRYLRPLAAPGAGLAYLAGGGGPLGESLIPVGGYFRTSANLEIPDIQVVLLAALPGPGGPRLRDLLPQRHGFALTIYQGTPYSRGEVRLGSADPDAAPRIFPNYFSDARDIRVLMAGVERMREVMRAPAIRRYISEELAPGSAVDSPAELEAEIRRNAATSYHQSGTCAMGGRPSSPVDPQLRVRGVDGLRVADTSIIPRLPNATLQGPAMMIGEKAAAMILAA